MDPFIQSLAAFCGPAIATIAASIAIAGAALAYQNMLQRLPDNVRAQVEGLAQMATQAIEQRYANSQAATGRGKKQDAMDILIQICNSLHIPLDVTHASAAIEAAVFQMNQKQGVSAQATAKVPSVSAPTQPPTLPRG